MFIQKALLFLFFLSAQLLLAQNEPSVYEDKVYKKNLRTVRLHLASNQVSYPIVQLGVSNALEFYFDDIDYEVKDYVYTVQLCNYDWTPSSLSELEYIEGFTEGDIRNYDYSTRVNTQYVHYRLTLPNQDLRWTKSGNYVLKVYEDRGGRDKELVITRRFMVVENIGKVESQFVYPAKTSLQQSHHEIDFRIVFDENQKIRSPLREIKATVLQNGRWDNALIGMSPNNFINNRIDFNYQDKIIFPALKEWRELDIRSLRNRSNQVYEINQLEDMDELILYADKKRTFGAHHSLIDLNGKYAIQNLDLFRRRANTNIGSGASLSDILASFGRSSWTDDDIRRNSTQNDYALVHFALESPTEYYDADLYIFGAMTDWELKKEFKLQYDEQEKIYFSEAWLKQGYYDYMYAYVDKKNPNIDLAELEGNWFETENDYQIVIYYRPAGDRYDRIVGFQQVKSGQ